MERSGRQEETRDWIRHNKTEAQRNIKIVADQLSSIQKDWQDLIILIDKYRELMKDTHKNIEAIVHLDFFISEKIKEYAAAKIYILQK